MCFPFPMNLLKINLKINPSYLDIGSKIQILILFLLSHSILSAIKMHSN